MPAISRRSILSAITSAAVPLRAKALPIVGVQLYTVRRVLPKKPLETLKAIEQIGYREVECTADNLDALWPSLKQTSLKPVSLHMNEALFLHDQSKLPPAIDNAASRGFEYVVCPWIPVKDRGGADMIRKLGQTLNSAGEMCRKAGVRLCYHNHAFEYRPTPEGRLLDILLKTANPKLVSLELDVMWAQVSGTDPVSVIKQYSDRIVLMHLKNVATDVKPRFDEEIPAAAFHDLSSGTVDFPAVLRAAKQAGVKHYFVEQDETPGDPLVSLRKSFEFLEALNV